MAAAAKNGSGIMASISVSHRQLAASLALA
jgi:hypothetical protein